MATDTSTVHSLATELSGAFETAKRPDGSTFTRLREGSPKWMSDAIRACHNNGGMMPDDWRYEFIDAAATAIADHEPGDEDSARDEIEPDVYYSEQRAWFSSMTCRSGYCDEYADQYGQPADTDSLIAGGQWFEKLEVFDVLLAELANIAEG